ncbi:MAG: Ubiquinol oxidase subunit 2, partial [Candidatus Saccharibacteria bacterium]|nr:Ubiquinol oxidase subunit 2 [Candidatus Saccharibacteria bacterium]
MKKTNRPFFTPWRVATLIIFVGIIARLGVFLLLNGKNIAVLNPQGVIADKQMDLIIFTTLLGLVVIVPVFIMLFAFAWKYREGNTKAKYMPEADGNRLIETIWWVIPLIIIVVLSVVTWISTHDLDPYKKLTSDTKAITVRVVALQWKWLFIYPEQGIATVNEVRFPEDTPVNFEITADAPMSAFWIPNLGTQTYAMNGMTTKLSLEADKVGEYRGSNTNINGEGYAEMNFKAISTTRKEFDLWTKAIAGSNSHLDWTTYEELAKPSKNQPVVYYMLHEPDL